MATVIRGDDNFDTAATGVLLSGAVRSDGGTGSGSAVDLISTTLNLTGFTGKRLIVQGTTGINEIANTSNTSIMRIHLDNGSSTVTLGAVRSSEPYGAGDGNNGLAPYTVDCVYTIPSSHASSCTLKLNGGINGSAAFRFGNQVAYTLFDGENAGITLTYFVI